MANPILYRYSYVIFDFLAPYETLYEHKIPVHIVTYVVSGEIIVEDGTTDYPCTGWREYLRQT